MDKWWAAANTVLNLRLPQQWGILTSFLRSNLLQGVSQSVSQSVGQPVRLQPKHVTSTFSAARTCCCPAHFTKLRVGSTCEKINWQCQGDPKQERLNYLRASAVLQLIYIGHYVQNALSIWLQKRIKKKCMYSTHILCDCA
jgi:hypothetical protein